MEYLAGEAPEAEAPVEAEDLLPDLEAVDPVEVDPVEVDPEEVDPEEVDPEAARAAAQAGALEAQVAPEEQQTSRENG